MLNTDLQWTLSENEAQEKFEEKVLEIIDALSARANAARASALVALRNVLQRRYLAALLSGQRATLADHVTKALRRGKDGEKKAAAAVAPILALQVKFKVIIRLLNIWCETFYSTYCYILGRRI